MSTAGGWPSGPRGWLPGGAMLFLRRHPDVFLGLARRYGDRVGFQVGRQRVLLCSRPSDVQLLFVQQQQAFAKGWGPQAGRSSLGDGLITVDGEDHRRERRRLQPLFSSERIRAYASDMAAEAERATGGWRDGQSIDVWREMQRLALAVVGRTLLGCDTLSDPIYAEASDTISRRFLPFMVPWPALLRALDVRGRRRLRVVSDRLDAAIGRTIAYRQADAGDDLAAWHAAQGAGEQGQTPQQVRDQFVTFLVAGHETTALALTWTFHLLAQHPAVEARLHAEADEALTAAGTDPLPRLTYARQVVLEAMRLYPPVWMIGRRATYDVEAEPHRVPAGSLVLASPYVIHRDERNFPQPLRFDPDRWTRTGEATAHDRAYLPFGLGARRCIGSEFALTEAVLVLAIVAHRWRLVSRPGVRIAFEPLFTLRPRGSVPMQAVARRPS